MDDTTNPFENDDQLPGLPIPEEESSAGNIRLAIVVAVMVALVIVGYVMLPTQVTNKISGKTPAPTTEVAEAAAPVDSSAEEAAPASPAVTAKEEVAKTTEKETDKDKDKEAEKKPTRTVAPTTASVAEASEAADEEPALVVAPTVLPTAIEPVEIAPSIAMLSGKVLDENGRPLAGATVMLKGTKTVASTDAKGNYSLEVPSGENTLYYGYGGYEDQVMRFRNGKNQNVTLVPKANSRRRR